MRAPWVKGLGVNGEFLAGECAAGDELIHQVVDGLHDLQAEAGDEMTHLARYGHHLGRAESVAVHNEGLHDLRHRFALGAVEDVKLFLGKIHFVIHF